jgi:hypothetical protein
MRRTFHRSAEKPGPAGRRRQTDRSWNSATKTESAEPWQAVNVMNPKKYFLASKLAYDGLFTTQEEAKKILTRGKR